MAGLNVDNFRITELTAGAAFGALVAEATGIPAWAVGLSFAAVSIVAGFVTRTWLVPILVGLSLFAARPVWLPPLTNSTGEVGSLVGVTTSTTGPDDADATDPGPDARTGPTGGGEAAG